MVPPIERRINIKPVEMETFCLLAAQELVPQRLCLGQWLLDWSLPSHGKIFQNSVFNPCPRINERGTARFGPHLTIILWNTVKSKFLFYNSFHFKIGVTATYIGNIIYPFILTSFLSEIRQIWCFISGQYFCQHRVINRWASEPGTWQAEVGKDGSISFTEKPLYRPGFLQFLWDYVDSDNLFVDWLLFYEYICHHCLVHLVMVIQFSQLS